MVYSIQRAKPISLLDSSKSNFCRQDPMVYMDKQALSIYRAGRACACSLEGYTVLSQ
jgi:hypothetical protein